MLLAIKSHLHIHSKQIASAACARMKQGTVKSQEGDHFHRVKKPDFTEKQILITNYPIQQEICRIALKVQCAKLLK